MLCRCFPGLGLEFPGKGGFTSDVVNTTSPGASIMPTLPRFGPSVQIRFLPSMQPYHAARCRSIRAVLCDVVGQLLQRFGALLLLQYPANIRCAQRFHAIGSNLDLLLESTVLPSGAGVTSIRFSRAANSAGPITLSLKSSSARPASLRSMVWSLA